jgi:hypothetical protein
MISKQKMSMKLESEMRAIVVDIPHLADGTPSYS